jgi:hypothetical protein
MWRLWFTEPGKCRGGCEALAEPATPVAECHPGAALLLSAPYQLPCDRRMVNQIAGMRRDGFWASP